MALLGLKLLYCVFSLACSWQPRIFVGPPGPPQLSRQDPALGDGSSASVGSSSRGPPACGCVAGPTSAADEKPPCIRLLPRGCDVRGWSYRGNCSGGKVHEASRKELVYVPTAGSAWHGMPQQRSRRPFWAPLVDARARLQRALCPLPPALHLAGTVNTTSITFPLGKASLRCFSSSSTTGMLDSVALLGVLGLQRGT